MLSFILYYGQLANELSRLLGVRFIPGGGLEGPVGRMLAQVIVYHNKGLHEFRDRELTKLTLLASELKDIEQFDVSLLKSFQRTYRKGKHSSYFGIRMELAAASAFIRKGIMFQKSESPDFIILATTPSVFVECGSAHLARQQSKDVSYKIGAMIKSKIDKPYCNASTGLFLDITNILHNSLVSTTYITQEAIEEIAKEQMRGRNVGATCLFFYILNKVTDRFDYTYIRIDNNSADPLLISFLDEYFVGDGSTIISEYDIPSGG